MKIFELKLSAKLPHKLSWKMNIKCLGMTPHLMPATPIFEKHCFFKNGPENVAKVENLKFFLHSWYQFYRAFQWYFACFDIFVSCWQTMGFWLGVDTNLLQTVCLQITKTIVLIKDVSRTEFISFWVFCGSETSRDIKMKTSFKRCIDLQECVAQKLGLPCPI